MDIMQQFNKNRSQKGGNFMNQKQQHSKKDGFTIIEVVLVLAIAGLIFLMVFIALPNLQRGQRDTQRRSDVARIATQIQNYQTSNRGSIPTTTNMITASTGFVARYLGGSGATASSSEYADPSSGAGYTITTSTAEPNLGQINYQTNRICGTDGAPTTGGATARNYVLRIKLENQVSPYCVDNR
jgi:prepilin-type N-terminal cleavage/methylation domain-containing protein